MTPGADVRSIPTLLDWLAALNRYRTDASHALSGIHQEIRRSFDWVNDQLTLWQRAVRDCEEEVTQAKAELAARKFPGWDGRMPDTTLQERDLRRAIARLEYAEAKVVKCRSWLSRLPKQIEEIFQGPGQRLQSILEADLERGTAVLMRQLEALERYAGLKTDFSTISTSVSAPAPAASSQNNATVAENSP